MSVSSSIPSPRPSSESASETLVPEGSEASRDDGIRQQFLEDLSFTPDPFQIEAFDAIDAGRSVLVSAPTGSGKTLVAAYAVHRAMSEGRKAFYTTPLKALSNQKFAELAGSHGVEQVGLLTGDTSIRPGAPIVVMTAEVLRNMLLAGSELLINLGSVILDEVHYLQDPYRGGVWEEIVVLGPPEAKFVCLSATATNASELGDWLRSVRGATSVVVERRRPITLCHHMSVSWADQTGPGLSPLLEQGRASGEALRVDQAVRRASQARRPAHWGSGRSRVSLPVRAPRRSELIELLDDEELLPAIVFIFSRAACDDAVRQCLREGLRLTTGAERASIRRIAEARVENLADDDLEVLGFSEWVEGLEAGIAAHHAGLVPAYRETVEECFEAGHLKVVFATETLSLGINMPARTTVIERFTKFGGAGRATLTSGEYAQLTGRAGRRGLDAEGHAVVLWTPETTFANVARVAVAPPPDLRSAFRPTYNLAVNLVSRFDKASTIEVLRHSFAQWQLKAGSPSGRDVLVEHLEKRLRVLEEMGYVEDWSLTPAGHRLSRVYHESDLLVSEALGEEALRGAEPSVLSGVLSALVFERRRTRPAWAHANHRDDHRDGKRASHRWGSGKRPGGGGDRLGEKRRNEIAERTTLLVERCEVVRALEQSHALPRSPNAEPSLATAVTAWARGASFGTALEIASKEAGDLAPGDFVRTVRQLADLVSQIALVAPDPETAESATVAHGLLMRDVVAAGASPASAIADVTPS